MKKQFPLLLIIFIGLISCHNEQSSTKLFINNNWSFKSVEDTNWLPATVPGYVHTDLLANNIIDNPFYRLNEHNLQWIDKKDWEYKTTFFVNNEIFEKDVVELKFNGLDTYANVFLNDKIILKADNMFMSWVVNCKDFLKIGNNTLRIVFESPIKIGLEKRENLGYFLPGAENDQSQLGGLGDKKTCVFTRKAQYHFGWDWGPRLVSSGIWQNIELNTWNKAKIIDINIIQKKSTKNKANLLAEIEIESIENNEVNIVGLIDSKKSFEQKTSLTKGINKVQIPFNIQKPELWWTNGLGNQNLYNIEIQIKNISKILSSKNQNIGLRTIKIIQKPDSIGKSFFFEVNGEPIFMKGANYIPQDIFLSRVSNEDYEKLIKSAVDANFNMLRVWGGGIYEKDIFYDLCDKYGILVWQDFMFACAMYPGNKTFLENVEKEAIQNVKRLRNHPSIALWCGDNEILSAWNRWGWKENVLENQGQNIVDTVWKAYDNIFHKILPDVVKKYDAQKLYWSSSPSAGFGELENGKSGDNHYWGVWWAKEPFSKYKEEIPRFMSEYGFQSFPELNSVKKYATEEDWDINSEVMKSHQRSSIGNVTIEEYMNRDYKKPKDFPMFLYVNHVLQAEGIKMAIEAHRRNMPFCMGSLYWQINDCWPVASWSGIDNFGNWKAMHYFVKKAFNNILVSPDFDENNQLKVFIISDKLENINGKLKLSIIDFDGNILWTNKKMIEIKSNSSNIYFEDNLDKLLKGMEKDRILIHVEVLNSNDKLLSENIIYFKSIKDLQLPKPKIRLNIEETKGGFIVKLSTNKFAKNLYLRADEMEGHFSDNYFDILAGKSIKITFKKDEKIDLKTFKENLKIYTLVDSF
ncbi:MAG: glycoside hydrolase family 2 protein [Bacteroidales bacterium]|nr:glycoside hydrolase family 2 protein [Bacteroidales bacterium]